MHLQKKQETKTKSENGKEKTESKSEAAHFAAHFTAHFALDAILPYVKLTCAYVEKRSVAPALALMRSVMLLCVKLTCTYVDKRRVAPTLAWMRRAIPDQYFLPNSDVILFYEKIYYIRISLSREE